MKIGFVIAALIGCLVIVGFAIAVLAPPHGGTNGFPCPNDPTPGTYASPQMICFTPSKALSELQGRLGR